jgi:DNA-binding GntR family transcriptional regulator
VSEPLQRITVVDELADQLRARILDGRITAESPLREVELAATYRVSRHTLRSALRQLSTEGLVRIEAHRGARVASLDQEQLEGLFDVRAALEVEAARLALERNQGHLPDEVHDTLRHLVRVTTSARPRWLDVARRHAEFHSSIVNASRSTRLAEEYARLSGELQLFIIQLRPVWSLERMRTHHQELITNLEREGAEALRRHLHEGESAVIETAVAGSKGRPRRARPA